MTRRPPALLGLVLVAGCASQNQTDCEEAIKDTLRSPSTFEAIEVTNCTGGVCSIEYDAANAYGTPIRSRAICVRDAEGKMGSAEVGLD